MMDTTSESKLHKQMSGTYSKKNPRLCDLRRSNSDLSKELLDVPTSMSPCNSMQANLMAEQMRAK